MWAEAQKWTVEIKLELNKNEQISEGKEGNKKKQKSLLKSSTISKTKSTNQLAGKHDL